MLITFTVQFTSRQQRDLARVSLRLFNFVQVSFSVNCENVLTLAIMPKLVNVHANFLASTSNIYVAKKYYVIVDDISNKCEDNLSV